MSGALLAMVKGIPKLKVAPSTKRNKIKILLRFVADMEMIYESNRLSTNFTGIFNVPRNN